MTLEELPLHKQRIALGLTGLSLNGRHSVNSYRLSWGLEPLSELPQVTGEREQYRQDQLNKSNSSQSQARVVPKTHASKPHAPHDPTLGRYVGTNLAILLKACGINVNEGCDCEEWIAKMNAWTIDENYAHRQEIIDRLKDRAAQERMTILQKFRIGVLMAWNGMLPVVSELVDEAIWRAKEAQRV